MSKKILSSAMIILFLVSSLSWAAWVNDISPDFSLQDLNGNVVSLESFKGRVVFIDFWASWCPPCKKEFPELIKFAEKYKDTDFTAIAINLDKKRTAAEEFLKSNSPRSKNFIVLLDPEQKVVSSYGARAMPTSFIVDKQGVIRYVHLGYREADPNIWAQEIEPLLK